MIMKIGQRFYKWKVIKLTTQTHKERRVYCQCDCGTKRWVKVKRLKRGLTMGCNCEVLGVKKVGQTRTLTYKKWTQMKQRCTNPKMQSYINYGARGISVCKRWDFYTNFLDDLGPCPRGYSLERIDVNKGYRKSNCKWIPLKLQSRNRTNVILYKFNNEKLHLYEIARITGIKWATLYRRVKKNKMSAEAAVNKPIRKWTKA